MQLRLTEHTMKTMTLTHLIALRDLVRFSVSSYAEVQCVLAISTLRISAMCIMLCAKYYVQVRIRAQRTLSESLDTYLYSSRCILPDILPMLIKSDQVSHDQFKVSCYIHACNSQCTTYHRKSSQSCLRSLSFYMLQLSILVIIVVLQGALHVVMLPSVIGTIVHDWKILRDTLPIIVKVCQLIPSMSSITCVNSYGVYPVAGGPLRETIYSELDEYACEGFSAWIRVLHTEFPGLLIVFCIHM